MNVIETCTRIKQSSTYGDKFNKYWLCPNISTSNGTTPKPYEMGLEYSNPKNIPLELQTKNVVKKWIEQEYLCIIWENK